VTNRWPPCKGTRITLMTRYSRPTASICPDRQPGRHSSVVECSRRPTFDSVTGPYRRCLGRCVFTRRSAHPHCQRGTKLRVSSAWSLFLI
jgi:hypothetical protein